MHFEPEHCAVCGEEEVWANPRGNFPGGWICVHGQCAGKPLDLRTEPLNHDNDIWIPVRSQLQQEFGFTHPEDGSQDRYKSRRVSGVPWLTHTVYWFIHNAIAHPLIAVLPFRPFFQFHDWTSGKMHGQ